MSEKKDLKTIAKELKQDGMRCNCDLDNWQPERSTDHSWVCRIHKAAIAKSEHTGMSDKLKQALHNAPRKSTSECPSVAGCSKAGLTPKGEAMPQTMAEWKYLAELYATEIEDNRATIAKLNCKVNDLRQKLNRRYNTVLNDK